MIYLDNAATTRPDADRVRAAMRYLEDDFFNPSALYKEGFDIHREFESARKSLLSHIADSASFEFLFTSCGSESDTQGLFSCARRGNFVTTAREHAAIDTVAA